MKKNLSFLPLFLLLSLLMLGTPLHAQSVRSDVAALFSGFVPPTLGNSAYVAGTDITSRLNSDIAAGNGGQRANQAVIYLPAGTFKLSSTVNLHGSVLHGAGEGATNITAATDFGAGVPMFTGDVSGTAFEIDDMTLQSVRPSGGVPSGTSPNNMDGVHMYDNCTLRRVAVNYMHEGIIVDGNHHTLDTVDAKSNYDGVAFPVSSDGSYFDDHFIDCSMTANGRAGFYIEDSGQESGSFIRIHTGFEPYAFLLGHNALLGSCQFLQCQFEGCGNADIADYDGTGVVSSNFWANCSGFGSTYNNFISGDLRTPMMRVGSFTNNLVNAGWGQGPEPGNFSAATGISGNTWICDGQMWTNLASGNLPAPTCAIASGVFNNIIRGGGAEGTFYTATSAIAAGTPVERDTGRYQGVNPSLGVNPVVAVSLQAASGTTCVVGVQKGRFSLAVPLSSSFANRQLLKADTSGTSQAVPATSPADGKILGIAAWSATSGTAPVDLNLPTN